jgi:hypothetical protein
VRDLLRIPRDSRVLLFVAELELQARRYAELYAILV